MIQKSRNVIDEDYESSDHVFTKKNRRNNFVPISRIAFSTENHVVKNNSLTLDFVGAIGEKTSTAKYKFTFIRKVNVS